MHGMKATKRDIKNRLGCKLLVRLRSANRNNSNNTWNVNSSGNVNNNNSMNSNRFAPDCTNKAILKIVHRRIYRVFKSTRN